MVRDEVCIQFEVLANDQMLGFQATQVIFERSCKTDSERMTKMDKYDFDQTGKGVVRRG